jgi:cell cycle sensor histidine kinase DivJ
MSLRMMQKRLQFVNVAWLALVAAAGLIAALRGIAILPLVCGLVLAALPSVVGLVFLRPGHAPSPYAAPLLVISWTLVAVLSVALTGGAGSSLTILFAVAPLVALTLDDTDMAAESAIFGAMAYFATLLMGRFDLLPMTTELFFPLTVAVGFAALVLTGLLIWTVVRARREELRPAAAAPVEPAEPAPPSLAALPASAGLLLLDVTPEGRVRHVSGDTFGIAAIKPGAVLSALFDDTADLSLLQPGEETVKGELNLEDGRPVAFTAEAHATGTWLVLRDLSDARQQAEETAAALESAAGRLKDRTAFFASLGHDLKTPLNAILGYADMMRAEIRGPMPKAYADYPGIIHESGQDLLLLVDDILDLAKADADRQRLEPEPVDLVALALSIVRQLENQADRAGVKLKLKADVEVWAEADARAVRQIWQNLVSNAIKYSESGGTVTLDAFEAGGAAVLSVTDKGAGMTEDDLKRVTEPFSQGGNSRGRVGTGLGLAVVRSFAELHGGQLSLRSQPGKGTRVEVTLPLANPADIAPLEDAAE